MGDNVGDWDVRDARWRSIPGAGIRAPRAAHSYSKGNAIAGPDAAARYTVDVALTATHAWHADMRYIR